jgi:hypothetical protein
MSDVLRITASIGTPLALLGLLVALGYYIYSRRLKYEEKKLEALPPDERAARTDEYLSRYGIDGRNLRIDDKVGLIRNELNKRHRRTLVYVFTAAIVFTVCFGLAVLAFILGPSQTNVAKVESTVTEDGKLFVDQIDIVKPATKANLLGLTVDVTLRNPGTKPINATGVFFRFDRDLQDGGPQDVLKVTGIYVITVTKDQAKAEGPAGRFGADAWYPSSWCHKLIVYGPISQSLPPGSTDRVRISVEFDAPVQFRGPMKSLVVSIEYNGVKQADSKQIPITLNTTTQNE